MPDSKSESANRTTNRPTLLDYLFWWWLATFRPKAFMHLYGDRYGPQA